MIVLIAGASHTGKTVTAESTITFSGCFYVNGARHLPWFYELYQTDAVAVRKLSIF